MFLGMGAQSGRPLPAPGGDAPNVVTATSFLQGVQRRAAAPRRQARRRHRRRRHVDRRRDGRAPARPHRAREADRLPGARDRRAPGARRGVGVGQAGRRGDADVGVRRRQDAGATSTRSSRRRPKASRSAAAGRPVGVVKDANGRGDRAARRAVRSEVRRPEARDQDDRGHRGGHPGRPHRLGDRPGGRFHRPRGVRQRQGRGRRRQELPGRRASPARSPAATCCARTCSPPRSATARSPPTASTGSCAARSRTSGRRSTSTRST